MIIGMPKEIKNQEYRVALIPSGIRTLVEYGHTVIVQNSSGEGVGITDEEYIQAGAHLSPSAEHIFDQADMIVKVKEPLTQEYKLFHKGQVLFTFLHLAPSPELTQALLDQNIIGIGYETVQLDNGSLPLLTPMSEIAGKISVQVGAHYLEKENGGSGVLLGGVPGVNPGHVTILGAGTVGLNAARVALGMGANVTILDINLDKLRYIDEIMTGRILLLASNSNNIEQSVINSDLVIGSVLVPGFKTQKLVTRSMVSKMKKGSVLVDVAIDQGGCFETSVPTSFDNPVYLVDGIIHYCVTNMPGAVARTSTYALTNSTFPYTLKLANLGYKEALRQDIALRKGLNIFKGKVTNQAVAKSVGKDYTPYETIIF